MINITFPAVMSKSRDYDAIEVLLQSVFNYFYTESIESKNVHNPYRCDVDLLPLLADFYRYSYTDVMDVDKEREIIASVPNLHHNNAPNQVSPEWRNSISAPRLRCFNIQNQRNDRIL